MNVLVTGGAGFIGSHLAHAFLADGHDVVVLDNLDPYDDLGLKERNVSVSREAAEDAESGDYTFVEGSITDEEWYGPLARA